MTKNTKTIPDADLSSAGDDYHILWTIQKVLDLLNFDEHGLKAVLVEGIEAPLSHRIDPSGGKLLGIDLVEYYSSDNFEDASEVIISQLKYSTRNAQQNLTFYSLYKGKKAKSSKGSIVHRLSDIYKAFLQNYGRDTVMGKLKIKLVSNRNFNASQLMAIQELQKELKTSGKPKSFDNIIKRATKYRKPLENLMKASGLKTTEFSDFMQLLDFGDCGSGSRDVLRKELIRAISDTSVSSKHQFDGLTRLILDKMMPESKTDLKLTLTDVIANLGFNNGSIENLFPVPQHFERLSNTVKREQLGAILETIGKNTGNPICLHGPAGIGKSTITSQIARSIPDYCVCITYDCYGNGSYLDPADRRHLHKNALVQLSNEIAKRVGVNFLISKNDSEDTYIKEFKRRALAAIEILKKRNGNAYLALIIDAADNSITAAQKRNENSFIHDLLEEPFPPEFKLIVTTRSYRKDSLSLPKGHNDILLEPFTLKESELHLKGFFPDSSDEEVLDFHELTKGIPRVQSYSIALKKDGIQEVINYLRPNGKTVEDLISERISQAVRKIGGNGTQLVDDLFINLITLPRPVPVSYLAALIDADERLISDLASDIWHGLVLFDEHLSFRDEDFENHIRKEYGANNIQVERIARLFLERSNKEDYASINLGNLLFEAGLREELKDIVLNDKFRNYPMDPIRNKAVYIERAKLAMKVAHQEMDNLTFFKLLFIAAEQSTTDKSLTNLLIGNPDLVIQFGDEMSLAKLNTISDKTTWGGTFHLKLSGIYSREKSRLELSRKHLKTAHDWLRWRQKIKDDDRLRDYPIHNLDIAYETETVLRLHGPNQAYQTLSRWKPKSVRYSAGNHLADNLLVRTSHDQLKKWVSGAKLPIPAQLFIFNKLFHAKHDTTGFYIKPLLTYVSRAAQSKHKFDNNLHLLIIDFIEALIFQGSLSKMEALNILNGIGYSLPSRVPHFSNAYNFDKSSERDMHLGLKVETLKQSLEGREMSVKDIYPEKFKEKKETEDRGTRRDLSDEKREFDRFFEHAVAIYKLRADRITGRYQETEYASKFEDTCKGLASAWELRHYSYWANDQLNYLAVIVLEFLMLDTFSNEQINVLLKSFANQKANYISLRLMVLDKIIHQRKKHVLCLELLKNVDDFIGDSALTATESMELFVRCSVIGSKIDQETGKYYFSRAIEAVSGVDYEVFYQIRCLSELTEKGIPQKNPKLAYQLAQFIEYADEKLGSYYDKKHFPYGEGIKGIFNLDPASVFTTVCRWHHRDVISLNRYIPILLRASLEHNLLNHKVASSLIPLNSHSYHEDILELYRMVISKFRSEGDSQNLEYFIETVSGNLLLDQNFEHAKVLYSIVKDSPSVDPEKLQPLEEYIAFRSPKKEKNASPHREFSFQEHEEHGLDLNGFDIKSSTAIEKAIEKITNGHEDHNNRWRIETFLTELKTICTPQDYVDHLDALVDIHNECLSYYSLERALKERLTDWNAHPGVRKWSKEKFRYVLLKWFNVLNDDDFLFLHIKSISEVFSVSKDLLFDSLIHVLPEKIEQMTDESIYESCLLMNDPLTLNENGSLISWALERWTAKINDKAGDGSWYDSLIPPSSSEQVVCDVLRFILGHPDKRLRWRAVHCIRRLINFGEVGILKKLLDSQNQKDCFPFQNKEYIFYWMSAKLYLWVAVERTSKEHPSRLHPFKDAIYQELFNDGLPHIIIRHFIKKTCLNLLEHDPSIYNTQELRNIEESLTSGLEMVHKEYGERVGLASSISHSKKRNFHFDALDTLPNWYAGAARPFHLSESDIADIADHYITNIWGYTSNPNEDDYIRNQLSQRDWHLTSKRHQGEPVIEDLETYFEYHAMFCAASELLEFQPMVEPEYGDDWDTWHYWIKSWANTWPDCWLSDLADTVPLEEKYWTSEFDKFDEDWRSQIPIERFDSEVGFDHFFGSDQIMAFGAISRHLGENQESVSIRSALVSKKGSTALLRAFQSAEDYHDYTIPFEKDNYSSEINENGFQYMGWLQNPSSDKGLDANDPFKKDIGRDYICFGKQVEDIFEIYYTQYHKKGYSKDRLVSQYRQWNEITEHTYHNSVESSGVMFRVDIHFILDILKEMDMCLILKCDIERQLDKKVYGFERRELGLANNTKLYLIQPNGKVKTVRGRNFKIRNKNS